MDKRIGAQFFTIRDYCKNLEDFDISCKKVSDMGYKIIQLSGTGEFDPDQIKSITEKYGLKIVCTHRPPKNYLENLENEIEFHKKIGAKICGIGAIPNFSAEIGNVENFIADFKPVASELKRHGLVFAYHNHAFEFEKYNGRFIFDIIDEKMQSDNFKYILDIYWLACAGINPTKFIEKYRDKIICVHFKDLKISDNKPNFAQVGEGNLDWDEIISSCENSSAQYALVEQDICDTDPFECLKNSYDFLSKKGFV